MNDSENKKQVNKVYTPKGGNDKASPSQLKPMGTQPPNKPDTANIEAPSQLKPMGTQHPINVLDVTPMGKFVKKLFGLK